MHSSIDHDLHEVMARRDQFHTPFQIEVVSDTCCIPLPPSSPNNLSVCVLMSRCVCACMSVCVCICVCAYSLVPGPDPSLCGGLGTRLTMMWCERIMSNYYNISVILTNGHHLGQYIWIKSWSESNLQFTQHWEVQCLKSWHWAADKCHGIAS